MNKHETTQTKWYKGHDYLININNILTLLLLIVSTSTTCVALPGFDKVW